MTDRYTHFIARGDKPLKKQQITALGMIKRVIWTEILSPTDVLCVLDAGVRTDDFEALEAVLKSFSFIKSYAPDNHHSFTCGDYRSMAYDALRAVKPTREKTQDVGEFAAQMRTWREFSDALDGVLKVPR